MLTENLHKPQQVFIDYPNFLYHRMRKWDNMTHDFVKNVDQSFIKIQSTWEMIINESIYECYKLWIKWLQRDSNPQALSL